MMARNCSEFLAHKRIRFSMHIARVTRVLIVMLVALSAGFLSRTPSEGQGSSGTGTTPAETFAQGALDIIIGDVKQEIVAGSTATGITTGSTAATVYFPSAPGTSVPAVSGSNLP